MVYKILSYLSLVNPSFAKRAEEKLDDLLLCNDGVVSYKLLMPKKIMKLSFLDAQTFGSSFLFLSNI